MASGSISGVPPIQPGQPIRAAHVEALRMTGDRTLPRHGYNTRVSSGPSGTIIRSVSRRARGGGGVQMHPFKALWRVDESNPHDPKFYWGCYYNSQLLQSVVVDDYLPIDYLLGNTADPDDASWVEVRDNDKMWLEVTFDPSSGLVEAAEICTIGAGDSWGDWSSFIELSGGVSGRQKKARFLIAYVLPNEDKETSGQSPHVLYQRLHSHLMLGSMCYRGIRCKNLYPYDGDGYANIKKE